MSSSTRKRGRPSRQSNESSPITAIEQSSASKKRKLNTRTSSTATHSRPSRFLDRVLGALGSDAGESEPQKSGTPDEEEDDDELDAAKAADVEGDELAADGSDQDGEEIESENEPAKLSTKSSSAKKANVSPPIAKRGRLRSQSDIEVTPGKVSKEIKISNTKAIGKDNSATSKAPAPTKLKRNKRYALRDGRNQSVTDSKESSISLDPLSEGNDTSNRKRHQPRRSPSEEEVEASDTQPKSILAASRPLRGKSKKNVGFEVGEADNIDLGFKDIPNTEVATKKHGGPPSKISSVAAKERPAEKPPILKKKEKPAGKSTPKAPTNQVVEEDSDSEEEEDDVPCAICKGKDSEEPNQILFCEKCDIAVHQKCYSVPVIPEGDWFCQKCSPEEEQADKQGDGEEGEMMP